MWVSDDSLSWVSDHSEWVMMWSWERERVSESWVSDPWVMICVRERESWVSDQMSNDVFMRERVYEWVMSEWSRTMSDDVMWSLERDRQSHHNHQHDSFRYVHTHTHTFSYHPALDVGPNMGWLRLVGSLNYRSLLQKRPIKEMIFCKRDLWF